MYQELAIMALLVFVYSIVAGRIVTCDQGSVVPRSRTFHSWSYSV